MAPLGRLKGMTTEVYAHRETGQLAGHYGGTGVPPLQGGGDFEGRAGGTPSTSPRFKLPSPPIIAINRGTVMGNSWEGKPVSLRLIAIQQG